MSRTRDGVVAGLSGGLVFGVLMQVMGMMPMVAQLVGSSSVVVGWVVHLAILMPAQLGMPVAQLDGTAWRSLAGHLVFGLVLGLVYAVLSRRRPTHS